MDISVNDEIDQDKWNALVGNDAYFRFEWKGIIEKAYNLKPLFILARDSSDFALIGSFKTVKGYISLPFLSYSGYKYSNEFCLQALEEYLRSINTEIDSRDLSVFNDSHGYTNSRIEINSLEDYWSILSKNTRNQIRKARRHGFSLKIEDDVDNFYDIYAKNMHRLGTPVHKKKFIKLIKSDFDDCLILTVFDQEKAVGSMLCLYSNNTLFDVMASTLFEYNKSYANYFLYWEAIKHLKDLNLTYLDMGRSTYLSGTYHFKQKFRPVNYSICSRHMYTGNDGYQLASSLWKHMPYKASLLLGPHMRKYLP